MRRKSGLTWLGVFIFLLTALVPAPAQQDDRRIALVIGNADYPNAVEPLPNAIKDATAVAEEFRRLDFNVELKQNLGTDDLQAAVDAFVGRIGKGSTAVFYFSGFGLQVARQSYLVPVNAQIWTEADVRRDGVNLDALLAEMRRKGAKAKIVVIDAARRNPFERRFRKSAAGLAPLNAPVDTLVLYSGGLNRVIDERNSGGHSLFAAELVKGLRTANLTMEEIFNRVRIGVSRASGGAQVPWVASSLLGDVNLGATASAEPVPHARDASAPPIPPVASAAPESPATESPESPPEPSGPPPTQTASLPPPANDCDRLAAHPRDPKKTAKGMQYDDLQPSRAIDACRNALVAHPGTPRFHFQLGRALHKAQSFSEALAEYRKAAGKGYEAAMINIGLMYYLGQGVTKDFDRAIADYTDAIRDNPDYEQAYNARGVAYAAQKKFDLAIADYAVALRLDPKFALAYNNRGNAYRLKGEYDRAIADYTEAIRAEPGLALAYYNRGVAYGTRGDHDRAIADYSRAIRFNPGYALAYNDRGISYNAKGDYDRAIADYTEAIRLDPKNAFPYNNRGNSYRSRQDLDRAFADYSRAIKIEPNYAMAYLNRAIAFLDQKKFNSAIEDCNESIRLNPDYSLAYVARGRSYRALRQYERAIADYDEAIRRGGSLLDAYRDRGFAYKAMGRKSEAIADFRRVLELSPSDAAAKDALRRLSIVPGEIPSGAMGPVRRGFAAIAYSPKTTRWGESSGYRSRKSAQRKAVAECGGSKQGCEVAVWYRKYCGGVAGDFASGAWAGGSAPTAKAAALAALKACAKNGGNDCELVRVGCTR